MTETLKISKNNITGKKLNEKLINSEVFEQLQDENLIFISKDTKTAAKLYEETGKKDRKNAKNLWKELLIDAICILKLNDNREKLYKNSKDIFVDKNTGKKKENWVTDFNSNLTKIRKMSTYGIDEISTYFDDFIEYESVLYGTGEYYRDHIHHVLSVWAIGVSLIVGSQPIDLEFSEGFNLSEEDFHFLIDGGSDNLISRSELWSMWTIISLCHDLGYPLEKTSEINKKVKKIVNHFGCLNFNELNFKFDLFNGYIVEKFLNIVASKTVRGKEDKDKDKDKDKEIHKTEVQQKYHYKISKSLEEYKHGMFSGLLVFKKLTYFLETDYSPDNHSLSSEDLRQFYIRKEILRAICGHTCPKIYHLKLRTLSFLLIICDELQIWGRPRFSALLSGDCIEEDKEVTLKEYKKPSRASVEGAKIHIEFKHKIAIKKKKNKKDEDERTEMLEKHLVKSNYETIHCLLRSAKDDSRRKINFQWDIIFEDVKYSYIFDSDKDSYDMVSTPCVSIKPDENPEPEPYKYEFSIY